MLELPRIYPITDRRISGLTHAEQVRRLIAGGARLIQLREKELLPGEWLYDALEAVAACTKAGVKLIINDRIDLAMVLDVDGVHLGQNDMPPAEARSMLGADAIIGYSTHTLQQVLAALSEPIDYIGFGPVFPTSTKSDPDATVGLELLLEATAIAGEMPVVAIGGIDEANLASVFVAGAASAAMISTVLSSPSEISANYSRMSQNV